MMFSLLDYDFNLPDNLISQTPSPVRDRSRMLFLNKTSGAVSHGRFNEIVQKFSPGDVLVLNNTQVIPARLYGRKQTGGQVEILILDYRQGLENYRKTGSFECPCLVRASKAPKPGTRLVFPHGVTGTVITSDIRTFLIRFSCEDPFEDVLDKIGHMPLPPYIKRHAGNASEFNDRTTYQTVYAREKGAIAAPTAGLHFTKELLENIVSMGVNIAVITLHVGYGTFLPVTADDIRDHTIHSEFYAISKTSADIINKAKKEGRRVVAVGTTSVRTLEYAANENGGLKHGSGNCDLFIYPGYTFKIIDAMITNFHLPKSTLLMLVSAFAGRENILNAYQEAIKENYRFYSYGDAMYIG